MSIKNLNGNVIAEMTIMNTSDKQKTPHATKLTGMPIHLAKSNNIFINFVSEDGRYYTVMYDYQIFYNAPMYYREAVMLTSTTGDQALPLVSKMAIFRNPVPKEYHPYLLGLLSLNVQHVIISKDKFDSLAIENAEINKFAQEFSDYLALCNREFFVIPESFIGINPHSTMSPNELKKIFLLLRNNSYSLAQIEVGNDAKASVVAKEIQNYVLPF